MSPLLRINVLCELYKKRSKLMGLWSLIGALIVLSATGGDSTSKIIAPQRSSSISSSSQANDNAGYTTATVSVVGAAGSRVSGSRNGVGGGTVVSGNGVIVAGGAGPSSMLNAVVEEPEFTEYIENVTVPAGRNVKLGCSVKNLGSYKVAWMHFEQSAILTVHNHVITRNPRISVTHDKHDRHRTWYLHINNVHEEDKGRYMCQINTVTAKTQFGYLNVVVPPNIDDALSSSDVIVREGSNISLRCRASGSPRPIIKWKRDDNSRITINKNHIVNEWEGNTLEITRISRLDMGAYLCIASNGIPPTVSKRVKVSVDFPPMLLIPHQLVGAPEGFNVTIECFTEAHPTSLNYWTRGEGPIIHDSYKYKVESSVGVPVYKTHMKLTVINVSSGDDGIYKCVAKNPRGETDGVIRLYVSYPPTTSPSGPFSTEIRWDVFFGHGSETSRSSYGQDKSTRFLSNLNEIGISERKSFAEKTNGGPGTSSTDAARDDKHHLNGGALSKILANKPMWIAVFIVFGLCL
ncbi:lachesin isoform X2 [Bactrocera oleae]|uniref:lachesin isoform X2 n=1 Tax=Bactrocera oleae TaxID=104688 RepID=UPI0017483EFE|nr:lachesin isoform X1 [Bactrocera oleae]XP_036215160.1 lachesin isoform X1 [Bactrocera oleae]XP_036215161.1 lachesin isoform X1 [Bactrocera oleae]XP_036215162.1 lachesin isoform X1 [Bactrocera oleae]XP_036215163.1 lachesin isoform X1 [Bactrocera oleae]